MFHEDFAQETSLSDQAILCCSFRRSRRSRATSLDSPPENYCCRVRDKNFTVVC